MKIRYAFFALAVCTLVGASRAYMDVRSMPLLQRNEGERGESGEWK